MESISAFLASNNGQEFVTVLGGTIVIMVVLLFIARWVEPLLRWLENTLTYISTAIILFAMAAMVAEVVMRKAFDSPIQGLLEGTELLVPLIVFMAISYTQARNGHVGMTLVVDSMPPRVSKSMEIVTLTLSSMICAILAYFGYKYSYQLWEYDDVTMTPPYWRTWPSAAIIVVGYGMVAVRMWLQVLHLIAPARYPASPEDEADELHGTE